MRSTRARLAAVAIAAGLALTACGSDTEEAVEDAASSVSSNAASAGSDATDAASDAASDASDAAGEASASASGGLATASASASSAAPTATEEAAEGSKDTYTMAQVKEHATAEDCWSAIDGYVYNLTEWIGSHPGGEAPIKGLCGTDGTATFKAQHEGDANPTTKLESFKLGVLKG